ncbi:MULTISPECIES: hypothetical protein [Streptomyces]|uniref:Uncharacterized protein n=2 Tax=Streptomyces TaxID=1883 RepID=A0ABT9LG53_STRGD|nr:MULTISPECIES: hypothetical protein [Streptomyces]MDP9682639.1 hypothetical protein [Streptomyces griseoviridis]GGT11531.1 hypothetical protein GCM10010240_51330 [Streptomyces griseoviridis]GGU54681.1 hypothetical protein GCM10010259_52380 [Streptomyces daghestanicus]GHI32273.1 hypothetical protein Sdagh_40030 [Streptomyces daghestanicus]
MACKFGRKLAGRTISKAQLDHITAAVEQKFSPLDRIEFSITSGRYEHKKQSLESVIQRAGSPTIVRVFSIAAASGQNFFQMSVKRSSINLVAQGDDDYFAPGFVREIKSILVPQPTLADKLLTHRVHMALRCLLSIACLAAVAVVLVTRELTWNRGATAALSALLLLYVERRLAAHVLLTADAKENWKTTEKLALAGVAATLLVGAVTNGVKLATDTDGTTSPPDRSTTATGNPSDTLGPDRDSAPSRSSRDSLPPMVWTEPAVIRPGDTFFLSGRRFTPGEDIRITARSGSVSCPCTFADGQRTLRADSKGEIGPVKGTIEDDGTCGEAEVTVSASRSESRPSTTTDVEMHAPAP